MSRTIEEAISTLTSLGGDAVSDRYHDFSQCLETLLLAEPQSVTQFETYHAALNHGFSYYYWKWDSRALDLYEPVNRAIERWGAVPAPHVGLLCDLVDFIFFLVWCFEDSSSRQSERLLAPLHAASLSFARTVPARDLPLPANAGSYRVAWLAMYAQTGNPMSVGLREVVPALLAAGHRLDVYSWRFRDEAFSAFLEAKGVRLHDLARDTPNDTILAVEAQARRDRPDIVVSDMNNGIPTALFSRKLAPVQIFLQAGMPAWPVQNLDAVFNSFGFDSLKAGWGNATMLRFNPTWDVSGLSPAVADADIAAERALLPANMRLIGSYGRLSKVTAPYLKAAEQILLRCPDVAFILGGTGDASFIKSFIAGSPVGTRMQVEERYVAGHVWGHILELLLDTWPVTGGESAREMLAKSRPVVMMHSQEMPAIELQRDPALVAKDWSGFVETAVNLLQDSSAYAAASARAGTLAHRMSNASIFEKELDVDMRLAVRDARVRRSRARRLFTRLKSALRSGQA